MPHSLSCICMRLYALLFLYPDPASFRLRLPISGLWEKSGGLPSLSCGLSLLTSGLFFCANSPVSNGMDAAERHRNGPTGS